MWIRLYVQDQVIWYEFNDSAICKLATVIPSVQRKTFAAGKKSHYWKKYALAVPYTFLYTIL